jgi:hypothetical protein
MLSAGGRRSPGPLAEARRREPSWSIATALAGALVVAVTGLVVRMAVPVPPPDEDLRGTIRTFERIAREHGIDRRAP